MSAAAARQALGAIGVDLVAVHGGPGARRAAALERRLAGRRVGPVALGELPAVPAHMRLPRAAQQRLARRVGLVAIAPRLAKLIDGALLKRYADAEGAARLDHALGNAAAVERAAGDSPSPEPVEPEALEPLGFAILREAAPPALRPLYDWAPLAEIDWSSDCAAACVALAREAEAA